MIIMPLEYNMPGYGLELDSENECLTIKRESHSQCFSYTYFHPAVCGLDVIDTTLVFKLDIDYFKRWGITDEYSTFKYVWAAFAGMGIDFDRMPTVEFRMVNC